MFGRVRRLPPTDAAWRPARLWNGGGGKGGVRAVILLNDDIDQPDLALTGGVWTSAQANLAAAEGLEVTEVEGKLTARLADGTTKSLQRPKPSLQHVADERFEVVRKAGLGPTSAG